MLSLRRRRVLLSVWLCSTTACGGLLAADAAGDADSSCAAGACAPAATDGGVTDGAVGPVAPDGSPGDDAAVEVDAAACADGVPTRFATGVVDHHFGTGQSHNQQAGFPQALFGPPAGTADAVVSLGNGGYVVLEFAGTSIVDGPGVDFIVFENPLPTFKELATVAVSDDGVTWKSFPCTWQRGDTDYGSCAGVRPVLSSPSNGIPATDPSVSGGDGFDLHDIGVERARYVRITDRVDLDGVDGVFDLDAVALVHAVCR